MSKYISDFIKKVKHLSLGILHTYQTERYYDLGVV